MVSCETGDGPTYLCFYNRTTRKNVQNCSSLNLENLPLNLPNFTDWFILENNDIRNLHRFHTYLAKISFFNLKGNKISCITTLFLRNLSESKSLKWLDLSDNNLKHLPPEVQELTNLEKIWLRGNPIHCDCDMTWMINWINKFIPKTGERLVVDYAQVKCHSGEMHGKPIYQLNKVDLGCYPHNWTLH